VFRAEVVKPGRTLTVCEARAYAIDGGKEDLVASMTGTLMALMPKDGQTAIETAQNAMA
jgi:acyl-coenzyme A thioesterase PaaI-like protein